MCCNDLEARREAAAGKRRIDLDWLIAAWLTHENICFCPVNYLHKLQWDLQRVFQHSQWDLQRVFQHREPLHWGKFASHLLRSCWSQKNEPNLIHLSKGLEALISGARGFWNGKHQKLFKQKLCLWVVWYTLWDCFSHFSWIWLIFVAVTPLEWLFQAVFFLLGRRWTTRAQTCTRKYLWLGLNVPVVYVLLITTNIAWVINLLVKMCKDAALGWTNQIPTGIVAVVDTVLQLNTIRSNATALLI